MAPRAAGTETLDVDALLADPGTGIIVCCGSGGVGKTTTAAALGVRAAEAGRSVVVLTIDPARRLAQSLGLTELDNVPRPVAGVGAAAGGTLHAMMLDMKRTFDEVVESHSTPEKAAQILANPFYQAVSSSFAGTQEYMAMEKLGQLRSSQPAQQSLLLAPAEFLAGGNRGLQHQQGQRTRLRFGPRRRRLDHGPSAVLPTALG